VLASDTYRCNRNKWIVASGRGRMVGTTYVQTRVVATGVPRSTDVSTMQLKFSRWPFLEKVDGCVLFECGSTTADIVTSTASGPSYTTSSYFTASPYANTHRRVEILSIRPVRHSSIGGLMTLFLEEAWRSLLSLSLAHLFGLLLVGCIETCGKTALSIRPQCS